MIEKMDDAVLFDRFIAFGLFAGGFVSLFGAYQYFVDGSFLYGLVGLAAGVFCFVFLHFFVRASREAELEEQSKKGV